MYVAKVHLYEEDNGEPARLAVPAGSEVTDADFERLELKKNDSRVTKVEDYNAWLLEKGFISESQVPNPGA